MSKTLFFIAILTVWSCAKIPSESVTLGEAIAKEGGRMHQLNILLVNKMFAEKRVHIDLFIREQFTPRYLTDFMKRVPEGTDLNAELPEMLSSIVPRLNRERDEMQSALEDQRVKLITRLHEDYSVFHEAIASLNELLASSAKINQERQAMFIQVTKLSNNRIDLTKLESSLDEFTLKGGDIGDKISDLNEKIDSIIEKK